MASVPSTFKAWLYERYGPCDDALQLRNVPTQPLGPTEVRIRVHSAAINPVDHKIVEIVGKIVTGGSPSADRPYRIGVDAAGVVVEIGIDVKHFRLGDAVYTMGLPRAMGAYTELFSVDESLVALKPSTLGFDDAAALPVVSLTSFQAVKDHGKLERGQTILVLGGSSSTGLFAIQYVKHLGANVIATTSAKNAAFVQSVGADRVIDYTTEKWSEVVAPHSVDVVYDCAVEPMAWDEGAQLVLKKTTGRFVTLMPKPQSSPAKFGATYTPVTTRPSGEDLTAIAKLVDGGAVKSIIDTVVPFEKAVEGLARSKTGRAVGKVVWLLR